VYVKKGAMSKLTKKKAEPTVPIDVYFHVIILMTCFIVDVDVLSHINNKCRRETKNSIFGNYGAKKGNLNLED